MMMTTTKSTTILMVEIILILTTSISIGNGFVVTTRQDTVNKSRSYQDHHLPVTETSNRITSQNNNRNILYMSSIDKDGPGEEDQEEMVQGKATTKSENGNNNNNGNDPMMNTNAYDDVDYPSFQDIDFTELDPLHDMDFEDYEEYLKNAPDEEIIWDDSVPTLNQIYLVGRVGNPPESRNLPDDNMVVTLSIALPRYYNYWERDDLQIEYGKEETEWFNLEVWGQTAEFTMKNVQKGMRIGVIGSIDTDYYQNKNTGKLSTNCKVLVQDIDILESKMETDSRRDGSYQQQHTTKRTINVFIITKQ